MTKDEYKDLFMSALERAIENADNQLGYKVPREIKIILFDKKNKGDTVDFITALDSLYLKNGKSYYVIDVGVRDVYPTFIKVFVRCSGHTPVEYEEVWVSPDDGTKLFKQVLPQIRIVTE
ncbi:MAG: hypothetical protein LCI00_06775 [Chloroflexi bacterium]|nr:hypothetical protein [Chloroflexota bacterium]MCC6891704.1 hypothetical protein [Anaerolineae bacterium]